MEVRIENLVKRFGDVTAVNNVNATFESGKLIALLGPSGCGKTTMLNMLSGIMPVTEGKIYFDDKDVTMLTPDKREVGLVFQNYALYPHMTVLENICFPLKIKRVPKKERIERAKEFARMVHIDDYLDRLPKELSGGQQQRVAIARALMLSPEILCFDEPTSALDPELTGEVLKVIRSLKDSDRTMIIVTHEMDFARSVADKIIFVADGIIEEEGTPEQVLVNPKSEKIRSFLSVLDNKN